MYSFVKLTEIFLCGQVHENFTLWIQSFNFLGWGCSSVGICVGIRVARWCYRKGLGCKSRSFQYPLYLVYGMVPQFITRITKHQIISDATYTHYNYSHIYHLDLVPVNYLSIDVFLSCQHGYLWKTYQISICQCKQKWFHVQRSLSSLYVILFGFDRIKWTT